MDKELKEILAMVAETQKQQASMMQTMSQMDKAYNGYKSATGTPTFTPLHGLTGIFSGAGIERDVVNAYVRPMGLGTRLRKIPAVTEDPRFSSITGYTATTGARATTSCADAPRGYVKSCELTAQFGLNRIDTQEIEMDKVMLRANRGDPTDLILRGEVLGMTGFTPSGLNQQQILEVVTMSEMVTAAVNLEREIAVDLWQGTVASGSMPGLDSQIATGQVDARNNTTCPALDSDVKDFGLNDVCGTGLDIVEYVSMMEWYLYHNASRSGLLPLQSVIVMRPELWFELSACWPCSYLSNRCKDDAGAQIAVMNDRTNIDMRDDLRQRMYLDVNGRRYPVITDDGIFEHTNANNGGLEAGEFASNLYFVPLTINGGLPATFLQYLDYRQASVDRSLLRGKEDWWWTDNGLFSWSITQEKWCYQLHLKTEPRVVLRTPQLAGKIQNIKYSPLQHLRSFDPDSPYNFDGGVSIVNPATRYAVWL